MDVGELALFKRGPFTSGMKMVSVVTYRSPIDRHDDFRLITWSLRNKACCYNFSIDIIILFLLSFEAYLSSIIINERTVCISKIIRRRPICL